MLIQQKMYGNANGTQIHEPEFDRTDRELRMIKFNVIRVVRGLVDMHLLLYNNVVCDKNHINSGSVKMSKSQIMAKFRKIFSG